MKNPPSLRRQMEPLRGVWFCCGSLAGWLALGLVRPWGWVAGGLFLLAAVLAARGPKSKIAVVLGLAIQQILSLSWSPYPMRNQVEGPVRIAVQQRVAPGRCRSLIVDAPDSAWKGASVRTALGRPGDTLLGTALLVAPRRRTVPGGFDERGWMASAGLDGRVSWRGDSVRILHGREPWTESVSEWVRRHVRRSLRERLDPGSAALWTATQLAESNEIPPPALEAFKQSGLFHMLSVGGFHMVVLGGSLVALLSACRVPRRVSWTCAAGLVAAYAWILGVPPPVARAAGAFGVAALAIAWGRRPHAGNSLCLVLGILVALDPNLPFQMGAQLTFVATASLLWLSPAVHDAFVPRRWREGRWDRWILSPILLSVTATLATAPILAWNTGIVPWIGIPAGCLGAFAFSTGFMSSFAVVVLSWLPAAFTAGFAGMAELCARSVWEITLRTGDWKPGSWTLGRPSGAMLALWMLGLVVLALTRRPGIRARAWLVLLAMAVGGFLSTLSLREHRDLRILFLDVGQGSAALVRWPSGRVWLLDAGPRSFSNPDRNAGKEAIVPALHQWGVSRLDAVALSHADLDHWGGLPWIAARFPPSTLLISADSGTPASGPFDAFVAGLPGKGWGFRRLASGQVLSYGDGARCEILSPGLSEPLPRNRACLVLRFRFDSTAALVPGDADSVSEASELASGLPLHAQVLAAGHHGSRHSTSLRWLRKVAPREAILSYGIGNRYGHPNREVLQRLDSTGTRAERTPDGSVLCVLDGREARCGPAVPDGIWRSCWRSGSWRAPWGRSDGS